MISAYLIVPVVAWVVGQVAKFSLKAARGEFNKKYLYSSGGIPSTHAAIVGALAVTALIEGGAASPGFGISGVLLLIVMIDAVNVRRAVGENRQALKTLYNLVPLAKKRTKDDDLLDSSQALGHTPIEVIAGLILGAITAYGMLYSRAFEDGWGLQVRPTGDEQLVYTVLFGLMLLFGAVLIIVSSRGQSRRLPTSRLVRMSFRHILVYPSLIGFSLIWAQDQGIDLISRRWQVWLIILITVVAAMLYASSLYDGLNERYAEDRRHRAAQKQLRKKKRRKR